MTGHVIVSKVANALVEDVTVTIPSGVEPVLDALGAPLPPTLDWTLDRFRRHYGGLWVGGRLTLTESTLEFRPNALNKALQSGTLSIEIDLRSVEHVEVLPGFFTKIIATSVGATRFKARCYGAVAVAEQIRQAVADAQGRSPRD